MEELTVMLVKYLLLVFSITGIVFHLLALQNAEEAKKLEHKLTAEYGIKKKFIPWLESSNMGLEERLIHNKAYNTFATTCLIVLFIFLLQI